MSPALAGGFLTAVPPGKSQSPTFLAPGTSFVEDHFSTDGGDRDGSGGNVSDGGDGSGGNVSDGER